MRESPKKLRKGYWGVIGLIAVAGILAGMGWMRNAEWAEVILRDTSETEARGFAVSLHQGGEVLFSADRISLAKFRVQWQDPPPERWVELIGEGPISDDWEMNVWLRYRGEEIPIEWREGAERAETDTSGSLIFPLPIEEWIVPERFSFGIQGMLLTWVSGVGCLFLILWFCSRLGTLKFRDAPNQSS